jgi:uncharacterized pyridoxal phosphate-containing UPF0001 family protein
MRWIASRSPERLSRDAQTAGCVLDVLLEVNVSGEASKHGFTPAEVIVRAPPSCWRCRVSACAG